MVADDRIDAADGARRFIQRVAEGNYVPLVRNGNVQPADLSPSKKRAQLFRLPLKQAVAPVFQLAVDENGVAVLERAAKKAVNLVPTAYTME